MKVLAEKDQMPVLPEKEGYVAIEKTVNAVALNLWAAAIGIPVCILTIAIHVFIWHDAIVESFANPMSWAVGGLVLLVALVALMFVFELGHGIAWCLMSGLPWSRMRFGFAGGGLVYQCRIDGELLTKRAYVRGLIIPDLILGLVPLALGLCLNSLVSTNFGAFVLMAAVGDFMIVNKVKDESDDTLVYSHPKQAGCFVYHKEEE